MTMKNTIEMKNILNLFSMNIEIVYIKLTGANDNAFKDDTKDVYLRKNNVLSVINLLKGLQCRSKKNYCKRQKDYCTFK